jgi:hypothetical protein
LNQLSVTLKADFSISAGLHFRYGSSYNEFSVNPTLDHYRGKLAASKASFNDVWETVKSEVEPAVAQNEAQKTLLNNALDIVKKMPDVANGGNPFGSMPGQGTAAGQVDESAFKNMWNFNLADAAFGYLVLEIESGRIGTEMRAQGFNFAHRGTGGKQPQQAMSSTQGGITAAQSGPTAGPQPPSAPPQSSQQVNHRQQLTNNTPNQQNKAPAGPARSAPSPVPAVPSQVKPATPQPQGTNVNIPSGEKPTPIETRNGNGTTEKSAPPSATKPGSPNVEKKPSTGLFIHNLENEAAVRDIFPDEDKTNITKIEKHGKTNHVVHFNSHENAKAALERQPIEHKRGSGPPVPGQPRKANVKWYDERGGPRPSFPPREGQQGVGAWQASNRGGANVAQRGGYQSGASDSEGARGRGGFRGNGRGRGGSERGSTRGGRGGGRGGSFNKSASGGEETSSTPTSSAPGKSTPAPDSSSAAPAGGNEAW